MSRAILLAAGEGTRLRPLTYFMPKCLVPIRGKLLLGRWLDLLRRYNIDKIFVNVHSHPRQVYSYLERYASRNGGKVVDYDDWDENSGFTIITKYEPGLLGTAGTVLSIERFVTEPCLIVYADNASELNVKEILDIHEGPLTMGLFRTNDPKSCGIAIVENGMVTEFDEKPKNPKSNLANAGVYVMDPEILGIMYEIDKEHLDFGRDVLPKLVGQMKGYELTGYHLDIGTWENYLRVQFRRL